MDKLQAIAVRYDRQTVTSLNKLAKKRGIVSFSVVARIAALELEKKWLIEDRAEKKS